MENSKENQTRNLKQWVLVSIVSIVFLQAIILIGVIILTKTPENLEESAVQELSNHVKTRGKTLEDGIVNMTNINNMEWKISNNVDMLAKNSNQKISEYVKTYENRRDILDSAFFCVLETIRKNKVTDGFIILETGDENIKDVIYLRDLNPMENSDGNRDILVIAGSCDTLKKEDIELDNSWNGKLNITEEHNFYNIPFNAGKEFLNLKSTDMGYFSNITQLNENDMPHFCYSIPLLDENHNSYGVIGVGITVEYMKTLMPSSEVDEEGKATYCLGKASNREIMDTIFVENNDFQFMENVGNQIALNERNSKLELYDVKSDKNCKLVACLYDFKIYNSLSPYADEDWNFFAVVDRSKLYKNVIRLYVSVIFAMLASLIICIIGAVRVAVKINRPIEMLITGMDKMSVKNGSLPKTGIVEFDDLANAIMYKNKIIYESGSKVADIIELSGIDLGVLEYSSNSGKVYCTKKMFDIFRIAPYPTAWKDNYIPKTEIAKIYNSIKNRIVPDETEIGVYKYTLDGEEPIWISIRRVGEYDDGICVCLDVTDSMYEKEKIRHDRDYDLLTDLYNRRAFTRKIVQLVDENGCSNGVLSMWDLDNLKYTNDTYGHDIGDKYICILGDVLKQSICGKSVAARFAGDEFALFVYDAPEEDIIRAIENLHKSLIQKKMQMPDGSYINVSATIGMARYSQDGGTYVELMKCADFAMYENKKRAKGNVKLFDRNSFIKDYILVQGVGELGRILEEERVRYAFQPIISLSEKKIFAYEALMRPISDILNSPDSFLRVAESQSMLGRVERITWFHAIEDYIEKAGRDSKIKLFVNSIPNQEMTNKDLEKIEELYGDILCNVVMESTETTKIDEKIDRKKREFCNKWGIETALDDYGAGYNNSDILVSRKYHYMKLDRSLVKNIHMSASMQTLVKGMINYSHANGIRVIAEGIELKEELEVLIGLGADFGQGYYFAKPSFKLVDDNEITKFWL